MFNNKVARFTSKLTRNVLRVGLVGWAKTRIAPGWLYQIIEKRGHQFSDKILKRRLFNGTEMECDLSDHIQQQIYFFGSYEPITIELLLSLTEPGSTFFDCGANVGFFTLMMRQKIGDKGEVHSFEPVPENFEILKRQVQLNGYSNSIKLNKVAVWNRNETLTLGLSPQHSNNKGSFTAGAGDQALRSYQCNAITLDGYVSQNDLKRVDIIKMDIEGAEKFAIEGSLNLIGRFHPLICLEINRSACFNFKYTPEDLWNVIKPNDYSIYKIGDSFESSGWIKDFSGINQCNVILVPRGFENKLNHLKWSAKEIWRKYTSYE